MEKIIRIEETIFKTQEIDWCTFTGYQIITDKQSIKIGISDGQSCCEQWGFFMSDDNLEDYINSELISVEIVDTELKTKIKDMFEYGLNEGDTMFVNFNTSNGVLQFVAYNSHNGYYGHYAIILSEQLNYDKRI